MYDKNTDDAGKDEHQRDHDSDDDTGFRINLPFGLGWLRGDGTHLSVLMPVIKWVLMFATGMYLVLRILQELR